MLKSQEIENEQALPAHGVTVGGNRVTPAELSQALAEIEERKQAEASRLAGTIPIDQAVSELRLDSTSEEIWAEVQAQRARAAAAQRQQQLQEQAALREAQAGQKQFTAPPSKYRKEWVALFAPLILIGVLFRHGSIPHLRSHPTQVSAPRLTSLSQVPDGKEVYADDSALVQVSEGKPSSQITVSENQTGSRWTMVKIGGHVYLRGYILNADSLHPVSLPSLAGKALNVYTDDNSGELEGNKTSNITLRIDKTPLQKSGGDEDYSEVTVPDFHPDPLTTLSPWH